MYMNAIQKIVVIKEGVSSINTSHACDNNILGRRGINIKTVDTLINYIKL